MAVHFDEDDLLDVFKKYFRHLVKADHGVEVGGVYFNTDCETVEVTVEVEEK